MTEMGSYEFGIAVEGDFPTISQLVINKSMAVIGEFIRDPYNEKYDVSPDSARGITLQPESKELPESEENS